MNLSQILNPPGSSTTSGISNRQSRISPPPPPPPLASSTTVLRFDNPPNGTTGGSTSRKHSSSVSVSQLEEQATSLPYNPAAVKSSGTTSGTYQKIKPNEINNGYSTHTFRANAPSKENLTMSTVATVTNNASLSSIAPAGGTLCQLVMSHNTPQDMSSSISTAKKKRRNNAASASESSAFQDSFQSSPTEQLEVIAATTASPKKKASKKANQTPALSETESQPLEIRFVMTDKDDQDKQRIQKQASTPKDESPLQDSPGDDGSNQDSFQTSPTPDFERNADGKFRCSWPRCGKEFTVASRLTTHYRIHSGKPPYLCGYKDCQKAFHTSSSLSHHRVVHTDHNLRPYVCRHNRCGATYTQLARLITHQRTTHSGVILFITQDSSSSATSSPSQSHVQSPLQSTATTPLGAPRSDYLLTSVSLPSTPSGHATSSSTFVTTGSVSPPLSEPTNRMSESSRGNSKNVESLSAQEGESQAATETNHEQQNRSSSRSPVTSAGSPSSNINTHRYEKFPNLTDDADRGDNGRGEHNPDVAEDDDSDEMRLKEEAALTMTSFREMAMLQHQRPHHQAQSSAPTESSYHNSHQQVPPNSNTRHYPNSDYYYPSSSSSSSYRDYPHETYQQQSSNPPYPAISSGSSPATSGSHPHTPMHSGWKNSHGSVGVEPDANGYPHHGQDRIPAHPQHSGDNRYHHYPPHPSRSHSPGHKEPQYRSHMN
ncbi:hypothetical protein BGX27_000040 [Mortierella sp. AM989]|nr:hypothetical protein BGX27_000040 [Mortierella sp. AM989]